MSSLTVYAPQITILDHAINMIDGLYSLNDVHKAGGKADKHRPTFFLRNQETKELITELEGEVSDVRKYTSPENEVIRVVKGNFTDGIKQGTYVCKELVYRYAMWISPKFALLVIRTFDKLVTSEIKVGPSRVSTTTDRKPLAEAVNMYCAKTGSIHSEVWKLVHQRFALEDVYGMTVDQVSPAVEYIHSLLIQAQSSRLSIGIAKDNMMWRYVGIIKHHEMSMALRDAKDVMANLQKLISDTQNHSNLIFDAFSEQNQLLPMGKVENERVYAQAKAFVAKQDAQKASWFQR